MCRYCLEFEPLRDAKKEVNKMTVEEMAEELFYEIHGNDIVSFSDNDYIKFKKALQAAYDAGKNDALLNEADAIEEMIS